MAREELGRYGTIECRAVEIVEAMKEGDGFVLCAADGTRLVTRKVLLATGVVDELPHLEGLEGLYGISVHHCPYCDAWEWRDRPLAVYGGGEAGPVLALSLTAWSADVLLCTGGAGESDGEEDRLAPAGVKDREEQVAAVGGEGREARADGVREGEPVPRSALSSRRSASAKSPGRTAWLPVHGKGTVDTGTAR